MTTNKVMNGSSEEFAVGEPVMMGQRVDGGLVQAPIGVDTGKND